MEDNTGVIDPIQAFAEPLLEEMDLELVEIQFRRESNGWVLRFFIDSEQGVTIDDCANASREISAYLEVEDIIDHAYHLEVSSPGAERPLKKEQDFHRFVGKKVRIKLRIPLNDQKVFTGILKGMDGQDVQVETEGQRVVQLGIDNISKARLAL